jgi:hypothetical protein
MSKKTLITIVAVLLAFLALPLIPRLFKSEVGHRSEDAAPTVPAAVSPPQHDARRPSIMTQAQYSQLQAGTTYAQCVQFVGSEGERAATGGVAGDEEYTWQLVNSPSDTVSTGEVNLKFRDGVMYGKGLSSKEGRRGKSNARTVSATLPAQRPDAPPYICQSVYDGIKNGSAYADCVQALGMEGTSLGRRELSGGTMSANGTPIPTIADMFVWQNPAIQARLTLSFRDGKLVARELSGSNWASGGSGGQR